MIGTQILEEAVYTFGPSHQKIKMLEEMAELAKELCKDLDGKGDQEHIAEEMADVELLMDQMVLIYKNEDLIAQYRRKKLNRLNRLIFAEKYPVTPGGKADGK